MADTWSWPWRTPKEVEPLLPGEQGGAEELGGMEEERWDLAASMVEEFTGVI